MEIDFNPNRIAKPDLGQAVAGTRTNAAKADQAEAEAVPSSAVLKGKLDELTVVRPEKVEMARDLISVTSYPPVELLDRIAILLAVHLKS